MYWLQYRRQAERLACRAVAVAPLLRYGQSRPAPAALLRWLCSWPPLLGYCDDSSYALPPAGLGLPPSPAGFTCQRDAVPLTPALAEGQEPPQGRLRRTRVSLTRNRGSPPSRVKRSAPPRAPLTTMTGATVKHHTLLVLCPPLGQTQPHTSVW